MDGQIDALSHLWRWFAESHCRADSPLYERIALAVADDPEVLEMVMAAPPPAHMPLTLLGAVHYLLLDGLDHPLAGVYAGLSDADPAPLFLDICRTHRQEVGALLATRSVQTNACGRSGVIGPALTRLSSHFDGPFSLVDVGTSAGINLLCDRDRLDYGPIGITGPPDSPVRITCRVTHGHPPVADSLPSLVHRVGIDRSPIDLSDPDDARWLLACVWPDTGRLDRTAASIGLARKESLRLVAGNATDVLPGVLAAWPDDSTIVVTTTSAFGYLSIEERRQFVALLQARSRQRPVAWLSSEGAGIVEAFADNVPPDHTDSDVLGAMTFSDGEVTSQLLGFALEHGAWIDWRASDGSPGH